MSRPFRILGLQQIAIGATDKKRLARLWIDLLGLTLTGNYQSEREDLGWRRREPSGARLWCACEAARGLHGCARQLGAE